MELKKKMNDNPIYSLFIEKTGRSLKLKTFYIKTVVVKNVIENEGMRRDPMRPADLVNQFSLLIPPF